MAYTASSDIITNLDATPKTFERTSESGGRVYTAVAEFTSAVFDALTAGQTAALARLPKDARILSVKGWQTTASVTGAYNIGLYRATNHDSANTVIDEDGIAVQVDMNSVKDGVELMETAAVYGAPGARNLQIDEAFTLTAGDTLVDVVVTITTIMGTASAVAFEVQWTI